MPAAVYGPPVGRVQATAGSHGDGDTAVVGEVLHDDMQGRVVGRRVAALERQVTPLRGRHGTLTKTAVFDEAA